MTSWLLFSRSDEERKSNGEDGTEVCVGLSCCKADSFCHWLPRAAYAALQYLMSDFSIVDRTRVSASLSRNSLVSGPFHARMIQGQATALKLVSEGGGRLFFR